MGRNYSLVPPFNLSIKDSILISISASSPVYFGPAVIISGEINLKNSLVSPPLCDIMKPRSDVLMAKTYQGYFLEDVHLMSDGLPVKLPVKRRVIVSIPDDDADISTALSSVQGRQSAAVKRFITALAELKDEDDIMAEEDWDELACLRDRTNAGFSRGVEL
jgi:hypothetical protein